jgi:hypothetical protein
MMYRNNSAYIVDRRPDSKTTCGGDYLKDSLGRWWKEGPCACGGSGTTGSQCAEIYPDGRIVVKLEC